MTAQDARQRQLAPYPMPSIDPATSAVNPEQLILAALPEAVVVLDPLGLVRAVNPAAERLFGRTAEQLQSTPIDRLVMVPDSHGGLSAMLRVGRPDHSLRWSACRGRTGDGAEFTCDASLAPLTGPGAPGRWVMTLQDAGTRESSRPAGPVPSCSWMTRRLSAGRSARRSVCAGTR